MIISHKHKFIFIKTEKTAGTSVEIALSNICGPQDIITPIAEKDEKYRKKLGFRPAQNFYIPFNKYSFKDFLKALRKRKRLRFYNLISSHELSRYIEPEIWDAYYKFTIERNPYDKLISWYYWKGGDKKYGSIQNFISSGDAGKVKGYELYSDKSGILVDDVFKFESLDEAMDKISKRLNLDEPLSMPKKKTKGNTRKNKQPYQEALTKNEIDWVSETYKLELSLFNYSF